MSKCVETLPVPTLSGFSWDSCIAYTPRKDLTPEQRHTADIKTHDKYEGKKARELKQELDIINKEVQLKKVDTSVQFLL